MRVTAQTKDYTTAVQGAVVVHIWHGETTLDGVAEMFRAVDAQAALFGKVYGVNIVHHSRAPSAEARAAIGEGMFNHRHMIGGTALVFEGAGFGAAAIRAVVTGLTMAANHPFPYRVFSNAHDALVWLHALAGGTIRTTPTAVGTDLSTIRRVHEARYLSAG